MKAAAQEAAATAAAPAAAAGTDGEVSSVSLPHRFTHVGFACLDKAFLAQALTSADTQLLLTCLIWHMQSCYRCMQPVA